MTSIRTAILAAACMAGLAASGCGGSSGGDQAQQTAPQQASQINGAGATFPFPIYSKWFDEYHNLHQDVKINYQSVGSGAGIRQLTNQTVFFGASDGPMTDEQLAAAPGKVLHLPTVTRARLCPCTRSRMSMCRSSSAARCSGTCFSERSRSGTIRRSRN